MFDRLKKAFSNAAKSIGQKELSEKDLDESLFDLNVSLLESDVSQEVIDDLTKQLKQNLIGKKLQKNESAEEIMTNTLKDNFSNILSKAGSVDLIHEINTKKQNKAGPFKIVFLGINGTGKTTTVAKVANLIKKAGYSVVIAAADTHRAGAIEQISSHAEKLSIKVISQRYGADPSAVARDALEYARKHYVDVVLIDTAGRMQTAKNLMDEIGKIVKVIKPDMKLFVGDSLSGNDTINQAKEFFSYTDFDGAILTKADADAKGGSVISISYITSKPIIYLGVGQSYDDIVMFNRERFVETIFNNESLMSSQKQRQEVFTINENRASSNVGTHSKDESLVESKGDALEEDKLSDVDEDLSDLPLISNPKFENKDSNNDKKIILEEPSYSKDGMKSGYDEISNSFDSTTSDTFSADSTTSDTFSAEKIQEKDNSLPNNRDIEQSEKKSRFGWFKKKK
jgi:fused signal recognition particle receptor